MRNLRLESRLKIEKRHILAGIRCLSLASESDIIYGVNGRNELVAIDKKINEARKCCELFPAAAGDVDIIGMEYLLEEHCISIGLSDGELLTFGVNTENIESVGSVSSGLQGLCFSPDQELLVLITCQQTFILMNKSFDAICEKSLDPQEFGVEKAVTVGWGSKETQFHGSLGKQAAKAPLEPLKPALPWDDRKANVTWRGDGQYFAISSIDPQQSYRLIRIWDRDGQLQYTSPPVNGLEAMIAWKPSGNLIASSQQLPNRHELLFFEKNGLTHGSFTLPFPASSFLVKKICWSSDSRLLLVWGCSLSQEWDQTLMIWSVNNYHWYQKQTLKFGPQQKVSSVFWDPMSPSKLHVATDEGEYLEYQWVWDVSSQNGTVAVVDGSKLLVTPFSAYIIPPPLSAYSLTFKHFVNQVAFDSSANLVVLLSSQDIAYISCETPPSSCSENSQEECSLKLEAIGQNGFKSKLNLPKCLLYKKFEGSTGWRHCILTTCKSLLAVRQSPNGTSDELIRIDDLLGEDCESISVTKLPSRVITMASDEEVIAIELSDNQVLKYDTYNRSLTDWLTPHGVKLVLPQPCPHLKLCKVGANRRVFALSERLTLFCDEHVLCKNSCTSFTLHENTFLLFTSSDHLLHCWSLEVDVNNFISGKEKNIKSESREMERGSRLILSTSGAKVVLQMPRGNLETIHPRTLLLDLIKQSLNERRYFEAFDAMRKNRINLNLLFDHNMSEFLQNVQQFVQQIGEQSVQHISLILSELQEEDVTETVYHSCYHERQSTTGVSNNGSASKLDLICDNMRKAMESFDPQKYFLPILVTYVKRQDSDVGSALLKIKEMKDTKERDEALKFILYMIDINRLYEEALGTYDLEVVLMVAEKSQKDPKEYLQFVNELRSIEPEYYRNFKIDLHLKRFKKALSNISKCKEEKYFAECLQLIEKQRLYGEAVKVYDTSSDEGKMIWRKYGDYLLTKKYYAEAALAFKRAHDLANAVKAHQLDGNWNLAIREALDMNSPNVTSLCVNLAENLKSHGNHVEAAFIYETYVGDLEEAFNTLTAGHVWNHASRVLAKLSDDTLARTFQESLLEHFETVMGMVTTYSTTFTRHVDRLAIVRQVKADKELELAACGDCDAESDMFSEVSSVSGSAGNRGSTGSVSGSMATRRSSRNPKKKDQKKYILKEGSSNEDVALVFALKEIVVNADKMQEECGLLIRTLFENRFEDKASQCQATFSTLLKLIESNISRIWPPEEDLIGSHLTTNEFLKNYMTHKKSIVTDVNLRDPPCLRPIDWKFALISM